MDTLNKSRPDSMRKLMVLIFAFLGSPLIPGPASQALTFGKNPIGFRNLEPAKKEIQNHSFGVGTLHHRSQLLLNHGQISFVEAVNSHLRSLVKNPNLQIRSTPSAVSLGLQTGTKSHDFRFFVNGVPLCEYHVRAHELSDRSVFVLGSVPDVDDYEGAPTEWPDFNLAWDNIVASIKEESGQNSITLKHRSKCVIAVNQKLMPVWKVKVEAGTLPYFALADGYETISFEPGFFDVDGTASVYEQNRLTGAVKDTPLTDLVGDGTLKTGFLKTTVPTAGWTQAKEANHTFNYPTTDLRFDEVQAFANVQKHFNYFKTLGFEWYGPAPLDVRLHVKPQGRANNALFMPGSDLDGSLPSISIDDGDGKELQNLVSDGDVVSHEFGHHVIYKTLRKVDGESLVLHEGLADFFAFARTQDGCLGESICPVGSGACIIEGQCLRTSINSLKYEDSLWQQWAGPRQRLGHLHGQIISGMLWDLLKTGDVPVEELPKLVLKAVGYFQESSGFRDLILALLTADKEIYAGKYGAKIKAAAENRDLGQFISDVDLNKDLPGLEGTEGSSTLPSDVAPQEKKEDKGDENLFNCGTIVGQPVSGGLLLLILALLIPLVIRKKPEPVRVPVPKTKKSK